VTLEQDAGQAVVKMRTPGHDWMLLLGFGLFLLARAASDLGTDLPSSVFYFILGCVLVSEALWIRTFGVDLTRVSANIRGLRRQSIPWQQVQAVLRHNQLGAGRVSLVLESGQWVTLRAPTTFFGLGRAAYQRDFHRIGQWWLEHRGESWRPVRPEAPPCVPG
jgi:hypothetical protein